MQEALPGLVAEVIGDQHQRDHADDVGDEGDRQDADASMIALCSRLVRAMMYMKSVPSADRLYIECRPEQASATSIWYWPIVSITPVREIG